MGTGACTADACVFARVEWCVLVKRVTQFALMTNKCRGTAESVKALILLSEWPITAQPAGEKGLHVVKPGGRVSDFV